VNLASRLQNLTKEIKTDIVVSAVTKRRLADDVETVPCPAVRVKGKSAELEVFRVPRACSSSHLPSYKIVAAAAGSKLPGLKLSSLVS